MKTWSGINLCLSILFLSILFSVNGQNPGLTRGKFEIIQDERVRVLVDKHIQLNVFIPGAMDGYRIQIYFDSGNDSKKRAQDIRIDFLNRFPFIPAYLSFQEPFFKIRTGDFRSKLEADGFLQKVLPVYPNSYIVKDRINFPRLDCSDIESNH